MVLKRPLGGRRSKEKEQQGSRSTYLQAISSRLPDLAEEPFGRHSASSSQDFELEQPPLKPLEFLGVSLCDDESSAARSGKGRPRCKRLKQGFGSRWIEMNVLTSKCLHEDGVSTRGAFGRQRQRQQPQQQQPQQQQQQQEQEQPLKKWQKILSFHQVELLSRFVASRDWRSDSPSSGTRQAPGAQAERLHRDNRRFDYSRCQAAETRWEAATHEQVNWKNAKIWKATDHWQWWKGFSWNYLGDNLPEMKTSSQHFIAEGCKEYLILMIPTLRFFLCLWLCFQSSNWTASLGVNDYFDSMNGCQPKLMGVLQSKSTRWNKPKQPLFVRLFFFTQLGQLTLSCLQKIVSFLVSECLSA